MGFALLASGCNGGALSLDSLAGHYEGFVVYLTGNSMQYSVSAQIEKISATELKVTLTPQTSDTSDKNELQDLEVKLGVGGEIQVSSDTQFLAGVEEFKKPSGHAGHCFAGEEKGSELCLTGHELQLSVSSQFKLILDQTPVGSLPGFETPDSYTISDLMTRAKTQNFDNQAAFESVVQAKLTAQNAYLNLLPHININSALNLASGSISTMVRSIGDLLPFFLPDRWYQAAALQSQSDAQKDAYRVVQADSMNIVQGLGLSLLRDEEEFQILEDNKVKISQIRDVILIREQATGSLQIGASAPVDALLISIDKSLDALQENMNEEKTALAQAAGFQNPHAVVDIIPEDEVGPVSGAIPLGESHWQSLALQNSVELEQFDHLIIAAQKSKDAREYQYLDPSGDDAGSIGLGLIDYIQVGNAMVQQVFDKRLSAQTLILKEVSDTLSQSGSVYSNYLNDLQSSQVNQGDVDRLTSDLNLGIAFDLSELATALTNKAASDQAQVADRYAAVTLSAQMNFLTFSGPYAAL